MDQSRGGRSVDCGSDHLGCRSLCRHVFVWSYLTDGDPVYILVQVSVSALVMLVLFAPLVGFLVAGASSLSVHFSALLYSVIAFIAVLLTIEVSSGAGSFGSMARNGVTRAFSRGLLPSRSWTCWQHLS